MELPPHTRPTSQCKKKSLPHYSLNCGVTKGHIICNFGLPHCVTIYTDIYVHVYFFCVDNTCN